MPTYGLRGGEDGKPYAITLERDGRVERLSGKANLLLQAGDLVTLEGCGGGGFGAPSHGG